MQGAHAAPVQHADVRRAQQAWLLSARQPLPVALADEFVDAAAGQVARANARDARGDVEPQLAAGKVAPRGNQYLVGQKMLQFAREPEIDVLMAVDLGGARNDPKEPTAFVRGELQRVDRRPNDQARAIEHRAAGRVHMPCRGWESFHGRPSPTVARPASERRDALRICTASGKSRWMATLACATGAAATE